VQSDGLDPEPAISPPVKFWNEQRLLWLELVIICGLAIGTSLLRSVMIVLGLLPPSIESGAPSSASAWAYKLVQNVFVLLLLWYVLLRRSKSMADIGMSFRGRDILWSIGLLIGGGIAHHFVYKILILAGVATASYSSVHASVDNYLFGGGISVITFLAVVVNPFFEELVLRAYSMTMLRQLTRSAVVAVLISASAQTFVHLYQGVPAMLALGGTFLVFSIYFAITNRIWPVILAHLYGDTASILFHYFHAGTKAHEISFSAVNLFS
jgi:membrane protease YdiL (CAAX protease family)